MENVFGRWLHGLDKVLKAESELVGEFQHNPTVGGIREFLVKNILERILPRSVTVETGKVIDHRGGISKQIDIILFDSRVPCLRSPGGPGLFPVEGVFATIEVKTCLRSQKDVVDALDNCFSVISLAATGVTAQ